MEAGECVRRVSSHAVSSWTRSPGCCGFRGVFRVGRIFRGFFFQFFFLRTHTACCKYEAASCLNYLSTSTDCESCTMPISTNQGSMEAGEYGLTRGTRFVARCLEVVAVAGLMWVSWCVFSGAGFFCVFFFFERTRPAASMRPPLASFTSLLVILLLRGHRHRPIFGDDYASS